MPFNLISCSVVDSERHAILRRAVWYPAPERDYLGFTGPFGAEQHIALVKEQEGCVGHLERTDERRDDVR